MRRQYTINSVLWYYALLIFGLTMFWALGMRKAQVVSGTVLHAQDKVQLKILLADPDDNIARVFFYSGMLATLISSTAIIAKNKIYKVLPKLFFLYVLLVVAAAGATFKASFEVSLGFADLRCDFGVLTVIAYGLVFVGYDKKAWDYILKTLVVLTYATTAVILLIFLKVLGASQDVYRMYFVYYILVLSWIAIVPLYTSTGRLGRLPVIVRFLPLLCLTSICFASLSRGWILQSFSICLVASWKYRQFFRKHLIPVGAIAIVVIYFMLSSSFFEVLSTSYDRLLDRMNIDSRTGQYETFFNQVSVPDFVQGCGLKATYSYIGDVNYAHFDNQFITMTFKMGVLFTLGYFIIMVCPGLRLVGRVKSLVVYPVMVVCLHLLAGLGLSTYYSPTLSFTNIVVAFCAGRCWYLISVAKSTDNNAR